MASHFSGSMSISNCRDTNGWSLPTPKKILVARICTFSTAQAVLHTPTLQPHNNTDSTNNSTNLTKVAPLTSPTEALHLLSQSLSAFTPALPLSSTIRISVWIFVAVWGCMCVHACVCESVSPTYFKWVLVHACVAQRCLHYHYQKLTWMNYDVSSQIIVTRMSSDIGCFAVKQLLSWSYKICLTLDIERYVYIVVYMN